MSLQPEEPQEAGVENRTPDPSHLEGAHILADQARGRLEAVGFTWQEILQWAEDFIAYEGSGDVEALLAWIITREGYSEAKLAPRETDEAPPRPGR